MSKQKEDLEIKSKERVVRVYANSTTDVDNLNAWLENGYEISQVIEFKDFNCADYILTIWK